MSLADYDECEIGRPCDMICANTFGSYTCSCHEGYRLDKMHCAGNNKVEDTNFKLLTAFKRNNNLELCIRTTQVYIIIISIIIIIITVN